MKIGGGGGGVGLVVAQEAEERDREGPDGHAGSETALRV